MCMIFESTGNIINKSLHICVQFCSADKLSVFVTILISFLFISYSLYYTLHTLSPSHGFLKTNRMMSHTMNRAGLGHVVRCLIPLLVQYFVESLPANIENNN